MLTGSGCHLCDGARSEGGKLFFSDLNVWNLELIAQNSLGFFHRHPANILDVYLTGREREVDA